MVSNTYFILSLFIMVVLISTNVVAMKMDETSSISKTWSVSAHLDEKCDKSTIQISQAPTPPLPNGIPTYTVQIVNTCVSGCAISNVHVACGKFSSAILINPNIFKCLSDNDCLVNGGKLIPNGSVISFKYATTRSFPLSVSSVVCS